MIEVHSHQLAVLLLKCKMQVEGGLQFYYVHKGCPIIGWEFISSDSLLCQSVADIHILLAFRLVISYMCFILKTRCEIYLIYILTLLCSMFHLLLLIRSLFHLL